MLLILFQNGMVSLKEFTPLIIAGILLVVDILLLKLGLLIVKAEKRTNMKWVGYSFLIQFGAVFAISSPLILMGIAGAFGGDGNGEDMIITAIITVSIISSIIDINIINIIHQIGLVKSLIVVLIVIGPIIVAMNFLGPFLGSL